MRNKAQIISGYTCTPYLHDHYSVEIKETLEKSDNVGDMYFVTVTFSSNGKLYFPKRVNHYILAKVNNCDIASDNIKNLTENNASFVFGIDERLFERETEGKKNFISICYTEFIDTKNTMSEIAHIIAKKNRIGTASCGNIEYHNGNGSKSKFSFKNNVMIFEVSSERDHNGHQGMYKYCEQMQRDVTRRGITLTSLMGISILDKLK